MSKACADLFAGLECTVIGSADEEVSGIAYRSDRVQPGDAFFCIVGLSVDGHSFAQDAIDRGAKVLVVERKVYLADATDVTEVVVSDTRKAMAHAAANFYDHPSQAFSLVGITGHERQDHHDVSGGAHRARLRQAHRRHRHGGDAHRRRAGEDRAHHARIARPAAPVRAHARRALRRGGHGGVTRPHALDLLRTWNTTFAVTAFTNLTQDHLDYHHTFDAYFEAKALLFSRDYPARRVRTASTTSGAASFRGAAPRTATTW